MYLIRLYVLMHSGQILGNKIKQSTVVLDDMIIAQDIPSRWKEENCNKLFVLRKRLDVYQFLYPVAPYSVFALSSRTFCATLATMLTYIVLLVKLREVGVSYPSSFRNGMNETTITL